MNETAWYALENKVTASTEEERARTYELTMLAATQRTPQEESDWWKQTLQNEIDTLKGKQH